MLRAVVNGIVLAEAAHTVRVEGTHYFPPESVNKQQLAKSRMKSLCPWKGIASYYHLAGYDETLRNIAWYYPHPSPLARRIKNHVAFNGLVTVEGHPEPQPVGEHEEHGGRRRLFGRTKTP
jgi:uncharacterized protein (DUF427 family)